MTHNRARKIRIQQLISSDSASVSNTTCCCFRCIEAWMCGYTMKDASCKHTFIHDSCAYILERMPVGLSDCLFAKIVNCMYCCSNAYVLYGVVTAIGNTVQYSFKANKLYYFGLHIWCVPYSVAAAHMALWPCWLYGRFSVVIIVGRRSYLGQGLKCKQIVGHVLQLLTWHYLTFVLPWSNSDKHMYMCM